ncbi:MAG TPA: CRISPR-associated protein Cas5 [Magnetospirillum sp.]|nr:CRISPR-associated protein Cas5 [Magnetospirillum sp.]
MGNYPVQIEVAGPLAMFSRPDTGATPTSYPVPTWSACKGIFEAIAMLGRGEAWIRPTRVEICKPRHSPGGVIRFQRYMTNYGGPLRKPSQISGDDNMQLIATVLLDVCYRLEGVIERGETRAAINARHHLQELFLRRLKQGRCFRTPCLGWSEFTCSYWGEFREDFEVDTDLTLTIPSFLRSMWNKGHGGFYAPRFEQDARVERGVFHFAQ